MPNQSPVLSGLFFTDGPLLCSNHPDADQCTHHSGDTMQDIEAKFLALEKRNQHLERILSR
ncbi:MAG: hypothetical protein R6V54_02955, partial [Desulfobacteraceae bacterium]